MVSSTATGTVMSDAFVLHRRGYLTAYSAGTKRVGEATSLWGTFHGVNSTVVQAEIFVNGEWKYVDSKPVDANGRFVIPITTVATQPGSYNFRVSAFAPHSDQRTYSNVVTLNRTR